jgi:DNA polymerase-4
VGFGVPLAEAYRRLPRAAFLRGDIKIYMDYWKAVQDIFDEYTPLVEPVSMDEAYLDLTGCRNRFKNLTDLGKSLKDDIKTRLNLRCSVGISISKMFARIACNIRKPDGLTVIGERRMREMLPSLAVRQLPNVGYKTERLLKELGVHTAGELRDVPRPVLDDLFGVQPSMPIRWIPSFWKALSITFSNGSA